MGQRPDSRLSVRFGDEVLQRGHTAVPNLVLNYYAGLGISPAEMLFSIHVWQHWWTERDPHPSLRTVAGRMGVSVRQAKRYVEALERKGFLHVVERFAAHGGQLTNEFDYSPLIRAVVHAARADGALAPPGAQIARRLRERGGGVGPDTPAPDSTVTPQDDAARTGPCDSPAPGGGAFTSPEENNTQQDTHMQDSDMATVTHNLLVHNSPDPQPALGTMRPQQLWAAVLATLAPAVAADALETWLRPARIAAWRDGVVVLVAPTTVAARRMARRYGEALRAAFAAVVGQSVALCCLSEADWRAEGQASIGRADR